MRAKMGDYFTNCSASGLKAWNEHKAGKFARKGAQSVCDHVFWEDGQGLSQPGKRGGIQMHAKMGTNLQFAGWGNLGHKFVEMDPSSSESPLELIPRWGVSKGAHPLPTTNRLQEEKCRNWWCNYGLEQ